MKVEFKLSGVDKSEKSYNDDIHNLVSEIVPIIESFYKKFDITVDTLTYSSSNSTYSSGKIEVEISTDKMYPKLSINLSRAGCAYLKPSERISDINLFFKNVSKEDIDILYGEFNIESHIFKTSKDGIKVIQALKDSIENSEKHIELFISHLDALDLFIF